MMRATMGLGVLALALALPGCASPGGSGLTPDQVRQLAKDFHDAGCGGRFDLDAGAATGQVGGEAHVQLGLHGECPPASPGAPPVSETPPPATTPPAAPSAAPGAPGGLGHAG